MSKQNIFILRIILLVLGSVVMGFGIALAISSGFGSDALSWLWLGIEKHTPFTLSQANLLVALLFLTPPLMFDRRQLGIGSILQPVIVGWVTERILDTGLSFSGNIMVFLIGTVIIGIGLGLYSSAELGKMTYDASVFLASLRFNSSLRKTKGIIDFIIFLIAWALNQKLVIGPILSVFVIGNVLNFTYDKVRGWLNRYQAE